MHGRGSSLHSHLLWVVSNSFGSNSVNWDGGYSSTYVHNESQLKSDVSPKLMSAILELTAKRTTNFSIQHLLHLRMVSQRYLESKQHHCHVLKADL